MPEMIDGMSMNLEQANMDKLRAVFPECFAEGKLDIDKLLALCGEYIGNDFEKYKFEWKGKAECLKLAQKRSTGTLRPCPEESVDWDTTQNLYIEGDNLEVLKLLQTAYYRKVKMIYIDPPYNTGNDFVYSDDFADPMARYKEVTQQTTKSNPETMGRFHTNWLNMMYPRLRLAANLLRDDGIIFISIDDHEVDNLKKLCNEVFGEENFIGLFCRKTKSGGGSASGSCAVEHDYVLAYAKMLGEISPLLQRFSKGYLERYKEQDEIGSFFWDTMERSSTKTRPYVIIAPDGTKLTGKWFRSEDTFKRDLETGEVRFLKKPDGWSVQFKQRLADGKKLRTILEDSDLTDKQYRSLSEELENIVGCSLGHPPKPLTLMQTLVNSVCNKDENDIVLDFFSGSATTAHAVLQLNAEDNGNRQFIMVQLPELCDENGEAYKAGYKNICEIGKERIRRAGKMLTETDGQMQIGDSEKNALDVGFRVFKLDSSNLQTWDATPVDELRMEDLLNRMNTMINRVKADRSDLDMVCEVMLKLGVPLTYSVNKVAVNAKTAYTVGDDCLLLVCLAADITPEDVEAMAEYVPAKVIISRDSFANDTAMANAYYILRDRGIELKLL